VCCTTKLDWTYCAYPVFRQNEWTCRKCDQTSCSMCFCNDAYSQNFGRFLGVSACLKNHSPHKAIAMTPYEVWFDQQSDLGHLRIFGCRCYTHVEKKNRTKWESHTAEGILMGYYAHEGLYAIYDVNKRVVVKKRDVTFFENVIGHPSMDGFGLAPGYDILEEPILETEHIPQILGEEDNCDTTNELIIRDLKPSVEDILATTTANFYDSTTANFHNSTYSTEEYVYVPVDTMVSTILMSFVHHALKE